jgi:hypothetical protein
VASAVVLPALAAATAWGNSHSPSLESNQATPAEIADASAGTPLLTEDLPDPDPKGYTDQYLFEGDVAVYDDGSTIDNEPYGQRFFATDLIYYRSDDDLFGDETEQGGRALWRRETLHWGIVDAELQFSNIDSNYLGRDGNGTDVLFTFRQSAMPISDIPSATIAPASAHYSIAAFAIDCPAHRYSVTQAL